MRKCPKLTELTQSFFLFQQHSFTEKKSLNKFLCVYSHTPTGKHICVCACEHKWPLGPEIAHPPGDGVTDPCELPDVSAENQTPFLCKDRMCY